MKPVTASWLSRPTPPPRAVNSAATTAQTTATIERKWSERQKLPSSVNAAPSTGKSSLGLAEGERLINQFRQRQSVRSSFSWPREDAAGSTADTVNFDGTTIDQQLGEIEALLGQGTHGTAAGLKTLENMVSLLKKDDSAVDALVNHLSRGPASTNLDLCLPLIGMLGEVGTPKAQHTLIGVAASEESPMNQREMALLSFAMVTEPAPEVDDWLRQLHQRQDDLSNSSFLFEPV
jgi:hypothetical protein